MAGIFISYRREDSIAWAGRLFDRLVSQFGKERIFMDIEGGIPKGAEFACVLEAALQRSDVLLALIGPSWLRLAGPDGNARIQTPDDWVRKEISSALECKKPVLPVLVGQATLPHEHDLPADIRRMCSRESVELRDGRWDEGIRELLPALGRAVPSLASACDPRTVAASIAVERICDADKQRDDLLTAIELLNSRLPEDEMYDPAELFRLVRHHVAGDFGPSRPGSEWRAYAFVAKSAGEVVGTLLAYDDLAAEFCFIAYVVAKKPGNGEPEREAITRPLLRALLQARREEGAGPNGSRVIIELELPSEAPTPEARLECIARLKLFELAAQAVGLDLRALDLDYIQPMLDPLKPPKRLLLAYGSETLGPSIPGTLAKDIVTWMYRRLYSEDIFEDPEDRETYVRHTSELLSETVCKIGDEVRLMMARHIAARLRSVSATEGHDAAAAVGREPSLPGGRGG